MAAASMEPSAEPAPMMVWHFVDEQNDVAVFDDFLDDFLQTLFELAAVFAACDQRGHIEGDHTFARNDIGHPDRPQ